MLCGDAGVGSPTSSPEPRRHAWHSSAGGQQVLALLVLPLLALLLLSLQFFPRGLRRHRHPRPRVPP